MGALDIQNALGVKASEDLTLASATSITGGAIDTQGFESGFMVAAGVVATISITGITRAVQVATATIADASGLIDGQTVTVSGANQTEYNITATITNITATTFDYTVAGSPTTPATGTIIMTVDSRWAIASSVAVGSYSFTDSEDNSTYAAVAADSVLPTRKQTANTLVDVTIDADDSRNWLQTMGVFGNRRYVKLTLTLSVIDAGASLTWTVTPVLKSDQKPFDAWDSTQTGDSEG